MHEQRVTRLSCRDIGGRHQARGFDQHQRRTRCKRSREDAEEDHQAAEENVKRSGHGESWLPFLNAYRTMCLAPEPDFRRVLEEIRDARLAA